MDIPRFVRVIVPAAVVAVANSTVVAGGFGGFAAPAQYESGARPQGVAVGDLDGDGRPDLVAVNQGAGTITAFRTLPDGTFDPIGTFPSIAGPQGVALGDFDDDDALDAAVVGADAVVGIHLNAGNGTLGAPTSFSVGGPARRVVVADLDDDGFADVATGNHDTNAISILWGRGDGTFDASIELPLDRRPWGITVADVDADGRIDLLAATIDSVPPWAGDTLQVLRNDGARVFASPLQFEVLGGPVDVAAGDFNDDGIVDAVIASSLGSVRVLRGVGDGTFTDASDIFVNGKPSAVVTADLNRDGDVDFVVVDRYLNRASVVINDGVGGFLGPAFHDAGLDPSDVVAGDFDGDGDADVAVANAATISNVVSVLTNETPTIGCAELERLRVLTGELQFGDLPDLVDTEGAMAFLISELGETSPLEPRRGLRQQNVIELEVTASIRAAEVSRLTVTVSGSVSHANVTGEIRLLNQRTDRFDHIGTFAASQFGSVVTIKDLSAATYVTTKLQTGAASAGVDGRVVLRLRLTADASSGDLAFLAFLDQVGITFE